MKPRIKVILSICVSLLALWLIGAQFFIVKRARLIESKRQFIESKSELIEDLKVKAEHKESKIEQVKKDNEFLKKIVATLKLDLKKTKQEMGGNILSIDLGENQLQDIQETSRELSKVEESIASLKKLQTDASDLERSLLSLREKKDLLMTTSERDGKKKYKKQVSSAKLKTTVLHVFGNNNFISIQGGENLGIKKDSVLNILRKRRVIAQVLVSHVKLKTSIADVIPDSLASGYQIKAGDSITASR